VNWADSVPNLLIGFREGLEAGLIVTILLAAVRKIAPPATVAGTMAGTAASEGRRAPTAPIWLGVLGAVMLSGSFAAVLTFSTSVLSSKGQEAVGGLLSVLAVGLVTWMIFWMRRTARSLSAHLREEVARAVVIGAGALTVTAFLAVAREGLETTLFLWTAAKASGQTIAPLAGAGIGVVAAVVLCWLLYRRAVRVNVGVFFNRTAVFLIVIAAGVLAYGLGDLQDAGLLPGRTWMALDLSAHVDPGSWWMSIVTGITDLSPKMTVLQAVAWLAYLAVVLPAFVTAGRTQPSAPAASSAPASSAPASTAPPAAGLVARWERLAGQRAWTVAGAIVAVPAIAAGSAIAAMPSAASAASTVTVTGTGCARDFTAARAGAQTISVKNSSSASGEVSLVNAAGAIVGEIEVLGPATTAPLTVTLTAGAYTFKCFMSGQPAAMTSAPVPVTGTAAQPAVIAVKPVTAGDLTPANRQYQAYAAAVLARLSAEVARIQGDLRRGDLAAAKADWLAAQLEWERAGASYNSFADLGLAVDGLPDGLPAGVADTGFTGLHRLEYGLWHGQRAQSLVPVADELARNVVAVRKNLASDDLTGDPTNLPLRAHEILEDALRDHLSGIDDQGAGAAYAMTFADLQVTEAVLADLTPLISARQPALIPRLRAQEAALSRALLATRPGTAWPPAAQVPLAARQAVTGSLGALLESLSAVPDLLEVRPAG
jgi:high-affinity iron transporter